MVCIVRVDRVPPGGQHGQVVTCLSEWPLNEIANLIERACDPPLSLPTQKSQDGQGSAAGPLGLENHTGVMQRAQDQLVLKWLTKRHAASLAGAS